MDDTKKRIGGYGLGAVVLSSLVYVGFIREAEADAMTLLGAASVQLSLAHSFPAADAKGNPNEGRTELLTKVRAMIEQARDQEPDLHAGIELEAHLCWAEGDYSKAANLFKEAQVSRESTPETTVIDCLNEARMLRAAESPEQALEVLDRLSGFLGTYATSFQLQRAHVLIELGRQEEAVAVATRIVHFSDDPNALIEAGRLLESHDETDVAEMAFASAAEDQPFANYYLARLKIRQQDLDSGLDLLKRAVVADARRVHILLKQDAKVWQPVRDDERFSGLFSATGELAQPGR